MISEAFREEVIDLIRKYEIQNLTIRIGEQFIDFREEEN